MQNSEKKMIQQQNEYLTHANLSDHERLDFSSVGDVRSNAQVDHGSATVYSRRRPIGNFSLNKISLVFIILQMHHHQRDRKGRSS